MWFDGRSLFASRRGPDDESWVHCPVRGCRFEIPVEFEDVAITRHGATHEAGDWEALITAMHDAKASSLQGHEEFVASVDADIARVQRWAGTGA